jgi:hypothetical protein
MFTDKQYAIDAMQQAMGALRVVVTDGNEVGYVIRRLEVSIDKLKRLMSEENALSPPPLPDPLVQQVAADASQLGPESLSSAPPGCRPDLSQADQSPFACFGGTDPDDAKTRLIRRHEAHQFSEPV